MHGGLLESDRAADKERARTDTAAAHPERRLTNLLPMQLMDRLGRTTGPIDEDVACAARKEDDVGGLELQCRVRRSLQPAAALRNNVEYGALIWRKLQPPRRIEFAAAVGRPSQTQILEHFAERVRCHPIVPVGRTAKHSRQTIMECSPHSAYNTNGGEHEDREPGNEQAEARSAARPDQGPPGRGRPPAHHVGARLLTRWRCPA